MLGVLKHGFEADQMVSTKKGAQMWRQRHRGEEGEEEEEEEECEKVFLFRCQ